MKNMLRWREIRTDGVESWIVGYQNCWKVKLQWKLKLMKSWIVEILNLWKVVLLKVEMLKAEFKSWFGKNLLKVKLMKIWVEKLIKVESLKLLKW